MTQIVLHAHLSADALASSDPADGIALTGYVEQAGTRVLSVDQIRAWCGRPDVQVTVKPVIDLHQRIETAGYTPTTADPRPRHRPRPHVRFPVVRTQRAGLRPRPRHPVRPHRPHPRRPDQHRQPRPAVPTAPPPQDPRPLALRHDQPRRVRLDQPARPHLPPRPHRLPTRARPVRPTDRRTPPPATPPRTRPTSSDTAPHPADHEAAGPPARLIRATRPDPSPTPQRSPRGVTGTSIAAGRRSERSIWPGTPRRCVDFHLPIPPSPGTPRRCVEFHLQSPPGPGTPRRCVEFHLQSPPGPEEPCIVRWGQVPSASPSPRRRHERHCATAPTGRPARRVRAGEESGRR